MTRRLFNKACRLPKKSPVAGSFTLFIESAAGNDLVTVRHLLEEGVDINGRDDRGWTALHHASANGLKSTVLFLLSRGARPWICDIDGNMPDAVAAKNGHHEIRKILRDAQKSRQSAAA